MVGEAGGDLRVEGVPRAVSDEAHDAFLASEQALEGGIDGEMDDPHRQRDPIAFRAAQRAVAVPALEPVREEAFHRPERPNPSASIPATSHVAVRCGRISRAILGSRRATWPARTSPRLSGSGSARMSPVRTSRPDPYLTGWKWAESESPKISGGDVRVRGAARMGEEAGVVGLRHVLAVDAEAVGEPHRDQRAVQAVLEREPHAEVRRQAQGRDQLRASNLSRPATLRLTRRERTPPLVGDLRRALAAVKRSHG